MQHRQTSSKTLTCQHLNQTLRSAMWVSVCRLSCTPFPNLSSHAFDFVLVMWSL